MACTQENIIHPSVGVFDLLDPASTLYFAQFILCLRPYFSTIRACDDPRTNFCWRLDHIGYDHPIESSSNDLWRIRSWLRGLCAEIAEWVPEPSSIADFILSKKKNLSFRPCSPSTKEQPLADEMPPTKGGSSTHSKASSSSQFLQVPPPRSRRGRSQSRSRQSSVPPQQQRAGSSGSLSSNESENGESESQPKTLSSLTASYYPASR